MKVSVVVISLLVLSSCLHEAQGIRLGKASVSERHDQKLDQDKSGDVVEKIEGGVNNEEVVCKGARCSSAGRCRKLMNKTKPTTFSINTSSKKQEGETSSSGGRQHIRVEASPVSDEILGIAEMDYSPATRKPPIHN